MAPVPISATGKFTLLYNVPNLNHRLELFVDVVAVGSAWEIVNKVAGGANRSLAAFGQDVWDLLRPFWPAAVAAPTCLLERKSGISYIPVDSHALTGTGSGTGTVFVTSQVSYTFKDADNHRANVYFFETLYDAPNKIPSPSTGLFSTVFAAITDQATASAIGNYVVSRGDKSLVRGLNATISLNRKLRRARGYA